MKAPDFDYRRPGDLAQALALLTDGGGEAQPLAGGQSLMPMLNFRVAGPATLVDLADIAELRGVTRADGWLRIGAMTRYAELADIDDVPLIAMALPHIAHDAIRNRGTLGGSLALADPAAEMPAVMRALGAVIELAGPDATREVAADDFFLGYYDTACAEDELIVAIRVPIATDGWRFGFHELTQRHGDYAITGVAIAAGPGADPVRIAYFGVSDRAIRADAAEDALTGTDFGANAVAAALPHLAGLEIEGDLKASEALRRRYAAICLTRATEAMR